MESVLEIIDQGSICTVRLNRPQVRNAFNEELIAQLTQTFTELNVNPQVRCIVLAANGAAFCAGADLNWMRKMATFTEEQNRADALQLATMLRTIATCSKPVVAAIQGDCYAGGMGLVAACDVAVAVTGAQFCLSEVKLGLIPATISPYVIRAMGARQAQRYFLTAERFDALQAQRIGMVDQVCDAKHLDEQVAQFTAAWLNASPQALAACKRLLADVAHQTVTDQVVRDTAQRIATTRASADAKEGLAAFFEKRKPNWIQTQ